MSREKVLEVTALFLSIVNKGVTIVQLSPMAIEFRRPMDLISLMLAVVELSRGHSESAIKSERRLATWRRRQSEAATRLVTKRLPLLIRYTDGDGGGTHTIAQRLNDEGAPVMSVATMKRSGPVWRTNSRRPGGRRLPRLAAWGAFRSLAPVLKENNSDDTRTRVRSALRRTIERIEVLILPHKKRHRGAGVAVRFVGSKARLYVIDDAIHRDAVWVTVRTEDCLIDLGSPEGAEYVRAVLDALRG